MHGSAEGARQSVKADGRFIPAVHLYAFHIIQQFSAVQNRNGIAEAECFGCSLTFKLDLFRRRSAVLLTLSHQKISTILLVLADSPCSGSLNSACIVAQARSAWLASSLRLAS